MKTLEIVPNGLEEILEYYGDPRGADGKRSRQWYEDNTEVYNLPFQMRLSWDIETIISKVRAHKKIGPALIDALKEIELKYGAETLERKHLNYYGGIPAWRNKRGGGELSTHCWLIAIDINPHIGRFGHTEDAITYPQEFVEAFTKRGFVWGGMWDWPDAQHFQGASGY